jgi:queuosine precursor transporter
MLDFKRGENQLVLAMGGLVVASNVLVQYPLGQWLTWGALTFPVAFFITDIATRFYGVRIAQRTIVFGALVGIVASVLASWWSLTTLRIAIASTVAFLFAQLTDMKIFDKLRKFAWWKAPIVSSVIGSTIDTLLFFGIAFSALTFTILPDANVWATEIVPLWGIGPEAPLWISLALADLVIKLMFALILLVPYRFFIKRYGSNVKKGSS